MHFLVSGYIQSHVHMYVHAYKYSRAVPLKIFCCPYVQLVAPLHFVQYVHEKILSWWGARQASDRSTVTVSSLLVLITKELWADLYA